MKNLLVLLATLSIGIAAEDPLAPVFQGHLTSSVQVFLDHHRETRRFKNSDFPLSKAEHAGFKKQFINQITRALNLERWVVRDPKGKESPVANRFRDQVLERKEIHGVLVEIHAVTIEPTGLVVPMVVCLPPGNGKASGIATFSGHSANGLHDLVVNLNSYQQGIAIRLAQAGFVSIAVEKIDTGYLSRHGRKGNDEKEIATLLLGHRDVLRSHQLRACIAAVEILAAHERVDEKQIGVTGVSLGGWLSVQTAMLNDRIAAVADFGRKTRTVATGMTAKAYRGQGDLCHIIPGMFALGGRNLHPLVIAPLPMLASHGVKDKGSHAEHVANFRDLCEKQYAELGAPEKYTYRVHAGGDTMASAECIEWFRNIFQR